MIKYNICPCCGNLHDDGGFFNYDDKTVFLCLDCLEYLYPEEIIYILSNV